MKKILIFPFLVIILILQIGIFSRIQIRAGNMDLMLLVVIAWALNSSVPLLDLIGTATISGISIGLISNEPMVFVFGAYLVAALFAYYLRERVWKFSILSMFLCVILIGLLHMVFFSMYLQITGATFSLSESFNQVILPSLLLNVFSVLPVYLLVVEIQRWIYPLEEEV